MKIFLVGFMGCGKTTMGHNLAFKLGYDFVDLDKLIESKTGSTIAQYFEQHGENAFRELERDTLQTSNFSENTVVSTGGGVPCFFDNMQWMNDHGATVYIELLPKTLAQRLEGGRDKRPLIRDFSKEELVDFITQKLEERNVFYKQAKYVMNGIDLTPAKIIETISIKDIQSNT